MSNIRPRQKKDVFKNVVPYIVADPYGVDKPIKEIQEALSTIPWLEKSFGRAKIMSSIVNEEEVFQPKCWVSDSEKKDEIPMIGLDYWDSYSFFYASDQETVINSNTFSEDTYQREVSLYLWINLYDVDPLRNDDFSEELKKDVIYTVKNASLNNVSGLEFLRIENNPNEVYNAFTFDNTKSQFYYPYIIFRIDYNLSYDYSNC